MWPRRPPIEPRETIFAGAPVLTLFVGWALYENPPLWLRAIGYGIERFFAYVVFYMFWGMVLAAILGVLWVLFLGIRGIYRTVVGVADLQKHCKSLTAALEEIDHVAHRADRATDWQMQEIRDLRREIKTLEEQLVNFKEKPESVVNAVIAEFKE